MNDDKFAHWFAERYPKAHLALATRVAEQLAPAVVGLELVAATEMARERGVSVRVVRGESTLQMVRADWRPDRINVAVVQGRVASAEPY